MNVGGKCGPNYSVSKRYFYFQVLLSSEITKSSNINQMLHSFKMDLGREE